MATLKSLQKPQIIDVSGSRILIKHPDISQNPRTPLRAPFTAAGVTLSVGDNDEFVDDDWTILGERGDSKTEEVDVNGVVTRGTSLTITNTTKFDHEIQDPVTKIYERKITIYGASSDGGTLTAIVATGSAIDIAWNRPYTEFSLLTTHTAYSFYVVKFYDGTTESDASDYIPSTGNPSSSVAKIIEAALNIMNDSVGSDLTYENLVRFTQDSQDEIVQHVTESGNRKDWSFEVTGADDSNTWLSAVEDENKYALSGLGTEIKYADGKDVVISVQLGNLKPMDSMTPQEYADVFDKVKRGELSSATTVGATTMTLKDSSYFSSSGTVNIAGDAVTCTANDTSTGILSGIPASGTGSITVASGVGRSVFQGYASGLPLQYTVFDGNLYFDKPISSTYAAYRIKLKYFKKLSTLSELSDTTSVGFYNIMKFYVASRIAGVRRNEKDQIKYLQLFREQLTKNAKLEESPSLDTYSYYNFKSTGQIRPTTRHGRRILFDT